MGEKVSDIDKIAQLLRDANKEEVSEIEAEIPYYLMSSAHGKLIVKAKWRR